jgi:16S rRNA processing protein RimM
MGRVAGSYGVRGWIRVERPEAGLAECGEWWIGGEPRAVQETKPHSGTLLAKLAGIGSREAAMKLKGSAVAVSRATLPEPEPGHYYLADLVGLEVVNEQGVVLGAVKSWTFNGAQDVMEVAGRSGERARLIPWIPSVIKDVDLNKKQIHVEWGADW